MTNWHNDNPIMTTKTPVSMDELIEKLTLNGSGDCRRFDLRIDSKGHVWSQLGVDARTAAEVDREGTVIYSDDPRPPVVMGGDELHERDCGVVYDYHRNYFGVIVKS